MVAPPRYRRDAFTWAAFGALAGFGFLNAVLGPALPFIRQHERISYVVASLHQVAFAVGGGTAGAIATGRFGLGRAVTIRAGLLAAAGAAVMLGWGNAAPTTIAAALLVSFFGTSALVRLWAALADAHGERRAVALTEGEVAVSLGGIAAPLLLGGLAATVLGWRWAFALGAVLVVAVVTGTARITIPRARKRITGVAVGSRRSWRPRPVLLVVFAVVALEFSLSFWLASYLHDVIGVPRGAAALLVSALYAANLLGRVVASVLARRAPPAVLLCAALAASLAGTPLLLSAHAAGVAVTGVVVSGVGIGALFPLTTALHVASSARTADAAIGQVLLVAAVGQAIGPLVVGLVAQQANLRIGLVTLPALTLIAALELALHHRVSARGGSSPQ